MPLNYSKMQAASLRRVQLAKNREVDSSLAPSTIKTVPSEAVFARQCADAHFVQLGLCVHGKVPRRLAERMQMPRLACSRCA